MSAAIEARVPVGAARDKAVTTLIESLYMLYDLRDEGRERMRVPQVRCTRRCIDLDWDPMESDTRRIDLNEGD